MAPRKLVPTLYRACLTASKRLDTLPSTERSLVLGQQLTPPRSSVRTPTAQLKDSSNSAASSSAVNLVKTAFKASSMLPASIRVDVAMSAVYELNRAADLLEQHSSEDGERSPRTRNTCGKYRVGDVVDIVAPLPTGTGLGHGLARGQEAGAQVQATRRGVIFGWDPVYQSPPQVMEDAPGAWEGAPAPAEVHVVGQTTAGRAGQAKGPSSQYTRTVPSPSTPAQPHYHILLDSSHRMVVDAARRAQEAQQEAQLREAARAMGVKYESPQERQQGHDGAQAAASPPLAPQEVHDVTYVAQESLQHARLTRPEDGMILHPLLPRYFRSFDTATGRYELTAVTEAAYPVDSYAHSPLPARLVRTLAASGRPGAGDQARQLASELRQAGLGVGGTVQADRFDIMSSGEYLARSWSPAPPVRSASSGPAAAGSGGQPRGLARGISSNAAATAAAASSVAR